MRNQNCPVCEIPMATVSTLQEEDLGEHREPPHDEDYTADNSSLRVMKTATLHRKPVSGYSTLTLLCSCDGIQKVLDLTVLASGHVRCPACSLILVFCEHCGEFTSSRRGNGNPLAEFGSAYTWNCIGCGKPKSGG